jgi:enoyl-CoA hydratase/carnithine racemase
VSVPYETILYEVEDPVALITLNRPSRLNAWNQTMARELRDAVLRASADRNVVGVIITGGGRAFCSGGDMKELKPEDLRIEPATNGADGDSALPNAGGDAVGPFAYLLDLPKPVIAAINGPAIGMGAVLALWADLRFMADEAMIAMAFSQRGTVAESGSCCLLTRLAGSAVALDLLMSSRRVAADEALRLGLVSRTAPNAQLVAVARDYIAEMARSCSPTSMAAMKRQVYRGLPDDLGAAVRASLTFGAEVVDGPDIQEGWKSFLEKRPAQFARLGHE